MPIQRDAKGRFLAGSGSAVRKTGGGSVSGSPSSTGFLGGIKVRIQWTPHKLMADVKKSTIWSLGRAGAYIMGIARKSIAKKPEGVYSPPGHPPYTHTGLLKRAIQYEVEREQGRVVIGPVASAFGDLGRLHEFGGTRGDKALGKKAKKLLHMFGFAAAARMLDIPEDDLRKRVIGKYPPRPFMGPALAISRERLPKFWAQSVRGG